MASRVSPSRKRRRVSSSVVSVKELLELVDDEQELRVGWEDPLDHSGHAELVPFELVHELGRPVTATRRSAAAGSSNGYDPGYRSVTTQLSDPALTLPYRRDEPGPHHRRLADPGRADDGHEPALGEHAQQLIHDRVAPVEVLGLGLAERAEPLVRVLGGRVPGIQARGCAPRTSPTAATNASTDS